MSAPFIAALDQGTTSTRCLVFDASRNIVARCQVEHEQITPNPGWLQHSPTEIAHNSISCIEGAIRDLRATVGPHASIAAMGVTNQRETTVAWSATTGKPLYDAIVWSDARTADIVREISAGNPDFARDTCGLPCSTYFSAVKMRWMLQNVEAVAKAAADGSLRFGTIDSWLIYCLSRGSVHVTDCTNASRTMLMNVRTLQWDDGLCAKFGVPRQCLPKIVSCSELMCTIADGVLSEAHDPIPITGCIGDQQGALVGQLCFTAGAAKNTYGTGCFLLANVGTSVPPPSKVGLLTTVGFKFGKNDTFYALEGAVAGAGSTIQWLRDRLGVIASAGESATLAATVPNSGGVVFVPAFGGLLAPYWQPEARGTIVGLTQSTTKAHLVRAVLDAVAQQVTQLLLAMEHEAGVKISHLSVDGGMVANSTLMQIQADSLGREVSVPAMLETTAAGAAICASLVQNLWGPWNKLRPGVGHVLVEPREDDQQRKRRQLLWDAAVQRSLGWAKL